MFAANRKVWGNLLIALWVTVAIGSLTPMAILQEMGTGELVFISIMVCLGIASGVMLQKGYRYWSVTLLLLLSCVAYVFMQKFPFIFGSLLLRGVESVSGLFTRAAVFAKYPYTTALILYFDLLLPLIFIGFCVFAVRSLIKRNVQ